MKNWVGAWEQGHRPDTIDDCSQNSQCLTECST